MIKLLRRLEEAPHPVSARSVVRDDADDDSSSFRVSAAKVSPSVRAALGKYVAVPSSAGSNTNQPRSSLSVGHPTSYNAEVEW